MKKLILFTMMTFCMSATAWAQKTVVSNETEQEENAFDVVEDMPEYPGGMSALMQFLGQNIKYPDDAILVVGSLAFASYMKNQINRG